jgi:hypothetical protein
MNNLVTQKHLIKNLFQQIVISTEKVCLLLDEEKDYFLWIDSSAEERIDIKDPIERFKYVLRMYTQHPDQKAKTVLFCPGFIAASARLFEAFSELNQAKKIFQEAMVSLRKSLLNIEEATLDNQFGNPSHERPQVIHNFLIDIGLEKLHFKHVYRCVPMIDNTPLQLGWTWAHTQSIKTITKQQALFLLEKRNKDGKVDQEIEKTKELPSDATLSIRQKLAPHLRINIVHQVGRRSMLKGTLPIVFPKNSILPIIRPAKAPKPENSRNTRSDKKIDSTAFLPSIRAYLNKDQYERIKDVFSEEKALSGREDLNL